MTRIRRPSAQTAAVVRALAADPGRWRYGYDLCVQLGMRAGSMYPILIRLADRGLLEASWESPQVPGRPARHLYRLTSAGRAYAAADAAAVPTASAAVPAASAAVPATASTPVARQRRPRLEGA